MTFGCTIVTACNYNPEATAFDGSCYYCYMDDCNTYPPDFYDCDGNCLNDVDADNICDEIDNCPLVYNPNQEDLNNDGIGDACEVIGLVENNEFEWHIYPNPLKSHTNINFTNTKHQKISVQIINLSGKIIYQMASIDSGHRIQNNFSPGCYIIQLTSEETIVRETLIVH